MDVYRKMRFTPGMQASSIVGDVPEFGPATRVHALVSDLQVLAGAAPFLDRSSLLAQFETFAGRIPQACSRAEGLVVSGILYVTLTHLQRALGVEATAVAGSPTMNARDFTTAVRALRHRVGLVPSEIAECGAIIAQRFTDPSLTLVAVADQMRVSIWHLTRMLKRQTGHGFAWHLRDARITRARLLLQDDALMVKQIAADVGYASVSALARQFRAVHGVTPSEYRSVQKRRDQCA